MGLSKNEIVWVSFFVLRVSKIVVVSDVFRTRVRLLWSVV